MSFKRFMPAARVIPALAAIVLIATLPACSLFSSSPDKPKPAELPANVPLLGVRQAWTLKLPAIGFPLQVNVSGDTVTVAAADGTVVAIDSRTGQESWRASAGAPLTAGVGSDGSLAAVVTRNNDLVALQGGQVLWKQKLTAETRHSFPGAVINSRALRESFGESSSVQRKTCVSSRILIFVRRET